jgi:drug/metabolite transporter (DMT)-like permease
MAATRFLIAGGILFTWATFNGESIRTSFSQWPRAFVIGGLLLLVGNGGVTWAEKYIASGFTALLIATEPLWVVMWNWTLSRKRPNAMVLLGVLIGLAGVALLVSDGLQRSNGESSMNLASAGVVLVSASAWAGGSVYSNRRPIKASTSMAAGMQMLAGGGLLVILAIIAGDFQRLNLNNASWVSIGGMFYLVVFGSLIGYTAYSWLLHNVTPARAATYAYVNPVVAVFLGWFIAGEPLASRTLIAATVIVGSVVLITTFGREPAISVHESECPTPPCV